MTNPPKQNGGARPGAGRKPGRKKAQVLLTVPIPLAEALAAKEAKQEAVALLSQHFIPERASSALE